MIRRRCHCRAGCLAWLKPTDVTVSTADGDALVAHLADLLRLPDVATVVAEVEALS